MSFRFLLGLAAVLPVADALWAGVCHPARGLVSRSVIETRSAHRTPSALCSVADTSLYGSEDVGITEMLVRLPQLPKKLAAVYAVSDSRGITRFIGISRHVSLSLSAHQTALGSRATSVQLRSCEGMSRSGMLLRPKSIVSNINNLLATTIPH